MLDYSYNENLRKSNISLELFKHIYESHIVEMNNSNILTIDGYEFRLNNKLLTLMNIRGKKLRRKNKDNIDYLNFYDNKEQQNYILDMFFDINIDIDTINISKIGIFFVYNIIGINKKILYQKLYKNNYSGNIIDFIACYYKFT